MHTFYFWRRISRSPILFLFSYAYAAWSRKRVRDVNTVVALRFLMLRFIYSTSSAVSKQLCWWYLFFRLTQNVILTRV